ncbi:hypothetical protein [Sphingomonas sp.]|uniref:hypothetical protein n=1 Tax=Sphingomonas sp. TaxID=28214 RepID=UPI001ED5DA33|nr:hypothetical protein [Sphingomonas sp.]MBX3593438.1 hypothetical protein [Sphingomonas sp.]
MRGLLAILGLAAVVIVVLMSLGMLSINMQSGSLPTIKFEGGKAPAVQADVGKVGMGYTNKTVQVPTVTMENKTIQIPTVEVEKADPTPAATQ